MKVDKEDLKQFGASLEYLELLRNLITSIELDLFEHNPNIRFLYLDGNPLKYIEHTFFDILKSSNRVRYVNFLNCGCLNQKYEGSNFAGTNWNLANCNNKDARILTISRAKNLRVIAGLKNDECIRTEVKDSSTKINTAVGKVNDNVNAGFTKSENSIKSLQTNLQNRMNTSDNLLLNQINAQNRHFDNQLNAMDNSFKNRMNDLSGLMLNQTKKLEESMKNRITEQNEFLKTQLVAQNNIIENHMTSIDNTIKNRMNELSEFMMDQMKKLDESMMSRIAEQDELIMSLKNQLHKFSKKTICRLDAIDEKLKLI